MNFHPRARERRYTGHAEAWLDEETYRAVKEIKDAYSAGTYKGNAHTAVENILRTAYAAGKAGQGGNVSSWWATYILTVCRTMEWYDPDVAQGGG